MCYGWKNWGSEKGRRFPKILQLYWVSIWAAERTRYSSSCPVMFCECLFFHWSEQEKPLLTSWLSEESVENPISAPSRFLSMSSTVSSYSFSLYVLWERGLWFSLLPPKITQVYFSLFMSISSYSWDRHLFADLWQLRN